MQYGPEGGYPLLPGGHDGLRQRVREEKGERGEHIAHPFPRADQAGPGQHAEKEYCRRNCGNAAENQGAGSGGRRQVCGGEKEERGEETEGGGDEGQNSGGVGENTQTGGGAGGKNPPAGGEAGSGEEKNSRGGETLAGFQKNHNLDRCSEVTNTFFDFGVRKLRQPNIDSYFQ